MIFARHETGKNIFFKKLTYLLTYQKLTHISFVSESDYKNYLKIANPKSFSIDGDPRIEEVFYKQEKLNLNKIFNKSLILGSTWDQDLKVIKKPILDLLNKNKLKKLVIAPHEPTKNTVKNLIETFKAHSPSLFSKDKDLVSKVIIVDQVGHLFDLYSRCEVAFVGGSFKKKVHSVLEPLSFGFTRLNRPLLSK